MIRGFSILCVLIVIPAIIVATLSESDFLTSMGMAFVTLVVFAATFIGTILWVDKMRFWNDAGLAAIIPMLVISLLAGGVTSSIAMWLVVKYGG